MRPPATIRRGFTLIELLVVIAIIAVLATLMIPMINAAVNSQRRGKATGEIAALMGGCERFRKLYGDFPCARSTTSTATPTATLDFPEFRQDLYLCMAGKQRLTSGLATNGALNLTYTTVPAGQERPIINPGTVNAGVSTNGGETPSDLSTCDEFIDPWGNVYDYRYRILAASNTATGNTAVAPYTNWLSPDCLIVSCGAKYMLATNASLPQLPPPRDFWDISILTSGVMMPTQGVISPLYYDDLAGNYFRSDNVTSFSGR